MPQSQDAPWFRQQAQVTLARLLPRLESTIPNATEWHTFTQRLNQQFPRLFELLYRLYGDQYDFFYHIENTLRTAAEYYVRRANDLKQRDQVRERDRSWYQSENMVGATLYVDLFASTLEGLREKIPYLRELGITYLHLMPLFRAPADNSDGGYAVSSYRETNPALGTMDELRALAADLREAGISLALDFIFNHTSNEHDWASAARAGDEHYRNYYRLFPDRTLPDQYEQTLREIFPEQAPGSFTWNDDVQAWVWTTFYDFQWDLNYENPEVLTAMMGEMLFLANVGVEVLRLDAVAFVWKRMGTTSENLPEAHMIIQAMNALVQIAAPGMIFKSEAIVHPDDVVSYVDYNECPISYNPTMMALIWDALATRRADVMTYAMMHRYDLPPDCVWVNYVRVHDDIGWSMADDDMAHFGINGYDHRQFLNQFYTGRFDGSFARGVGFGYNPKNQDLRIAGTAASLAGLEQALELGNDLYYRHALERLLMIHSLILAASGIPLIYIGDELATLNDYSYQDVPGKAADARWVHRSRYDWQHADVRDKRATPHGEMFSRLTFMIGVRKHTPALGNAPTRFFNTHNAHVLGFARDETVFCLFNFSEFEQHIPRHVLDVQWNAPAKSINLAKGNEVDLKEGVGLAPYDYLWLSSGT